MSEEKQKQKILVIAEKPSVARDYARVLKCSGKGEGCIVGEDYIVSWAVGHLIELCPPDKYDEKYKRWNYQDLPIIPTTMETQVIRGSGKQFQILKKLMNSKEVSRIICGTDSGREGELIFRYIYEAVGCKKPFDRLWVSSMTDEAIRKGFQELKDGREYDTLYASAKCRSEADWLVGMNGSRAFTVKYDALLTIGRVQTPTLSIIVNRQKEIDAFVPKEYFEVKLKHPAGGISTPEGETRDNVAFDSLWFRMNEKQKETHIDAAEEAERIRSGALAAGKAVVNAVSKTPGKQLPPLLYDLTELQRDANRRFGYSANKTLNLAQSLYEKHKLLTYPRTDSRYLPEDMKETVRKTLHAINIPEFHQALMGIPELRFNKRIIDNSKITDHHAVIPTPKTPDLSKLSGEEANIYRMVCQRLIEVFYPAYEYETTEVILKAEDPLQPYSETFLAKGRVITCMGFMALRKKEGAIAEGEGKPESKPKGKKKSSSSDDDEVSDLPEMKEGDMVIIASAEVQSKKTQPPKPFTEATLLTAMEYAGKYIEDEELKEEMDKLSLGTPATRASIIERLIQVKYIRRAGKALLPTEKGKQLIAVVPVELRSPEMTGKWERSLERIYR
ncbi:MAG: DNA topoisomerase 3, partial [Lachnospiraceae bacterium]|nr:DNA topoisomerase 3 [Lachnospiraceae bacterium]